MTEKGLVYVPPQYRVNIEVGKNPVQQLLRPQGRQEFYFWEASYQGRPQIVCLRPDNSRVLLVTHRVAPDSFDGDILLIQAESLSLETLTEESRRRWITPTATDTICIADAEALATQVRSSWKDQFFYRAENRAMQEEGLRNPQLGALFATLAHWTIAPEQPATIAMPTGAGKTETMLTLMVNQRIERLLVIVPTSALREQIASKFLTLGVLRRAGVVGPEALYPLVGMVEHQFESGDQAERFLRCCNVVVTTMQAINGCVEEVRRKFSELCSHLVIDEAHHVKAPSWDHFRSRFHGKPILQFTATPFREDGKHVGGKMIYCYPLRKAQEEAYFKPIRFRSIFTYVDPDRKIAQVALDQLKLDLEAGLDHLIMARVDTIKRAHEVHAIYQELASEFTPLCIHSQIRSTVRCKAIQSLRARASRIVVCVDMLGEGFDLPQLKIAALHDVHKSLAITLQFTGRFTRTIGRDEPPVGDATMVANRARSGVNEKLRALYAEDPDWNQIIRELSEQATGEEEQRSEFQRSFQSLPREVPIQILEPKMSTVVYRVDGSTWDPEAINLLFPEELRLTKEIARSDEHHIAWFVTREVTEVLWGEMRDIENVMHHLYLMHWDKERSLLFINSSNNSSLHEELAKTMAGESAEIIRGETVYRAMHNINRLVPTNLGLLDLVSRTRRFMMLVGADTTEGLDPVQSQSKTKTNLFGFGFEGGERVSIGCSLKGRIWSYLVARDLSEWMHWCRHVGEKLIDTSINTDSIFKNFVKPVYVRERPALVPLAIEWPLAFLAEQKDKISVKVKETEVLFFDAGLEIVDHTRENPILFRVVAGDSYAEYRVSFGADGTRYLPMGEEVTIRMGKRKQLLSEWFRQYAPRLLFEQDTFIEHDLLLRINRDIPPYDPARIEVWDWNGIDIKRESQGASRTPGTIQHQAIQYVRASGIPWDVVFDDDDSGEVADIVALRIESNRLIVHLYHCKYSGEANVGSRVDDFYAVCGQTQKSVRWRERKGLAELIPHLIHRDQQRLEKGEATRFEHGDLQVLEDIARRLELLRPEFRIVVVQPGLSRALASRPVLELLAATALYLHETYNVEFSVVASS